MQYKVILIFCDSSILDVTYRRQAMVGVAETRFCFKTWHVANSGTPYVITFVIEAIVLIIRKCRSTADHLSHIKRVSEMCISVISRGLHQIVFFF